MLPSECINDALQAPEGKQANGENAVEGAHTMEEIPPTIMDTKGFKDDEDFYPVQVCTHPVLLHMVVLVHRHVAIGHLNLMSSSEGRLGSGGKQTTKRHALAFMAATSRDLETPTLWCTADDHTELQGRIDPRKTMDRLNRKPWSMKERGRIMTFLLRSERVR